jgi:hypothetical protein
MGKPLPDDVLLCADCAQRLSPEQVERLAHDVRLRGVPL